MNKIFVYSIGFLLLAGSPLCVIAQPNEEREKTTRDDINKFTVDEYIKLISPIAKGEMRRVGIPASITIAQAILESNFGNSDLAIKANNHFGIKCHSDWDGLTYYQDDDEQHECFRGYISMELSFKDHSDFLKNRTRYAPLFELSSTDYKSWAKGLQKAGYATNPNYAALLIKIIEDKKLDLYDTARKESLEINTEQKLVEQFKGKLLTYNNTKTVIAQYDLDARQMAELHGIKYQKFLKYNDLYDGQPTIPGQKLYLQKKPKEGYLKVHQTKVNETMHSISQKECIQLAELYKKNLMVPGEEPAIGSVLQLQETAKVKPLLKSEEEKKELYKKLNLNKFLEDISSGQMTEKTEINEQVEPIVIEPIVEKVPEVTLEKTVNEPKDTTVAQVVPVEKPEIAPVKINDQPKDSLGKDKPAVVLPPVEKKPDPVVEAPISPIKTEKPYFHTVLAGEGLYSLSRRYGSTLQEIQEWNKLSDTNIKIGQKLIVGYGEPKVSEKKPDIAPTPTPTVDKKDKILHTVEPGEDLLLIAGKYDITYQNLVKWNQLSTTVIHPGQLLIVGYKNAPSEKIEIKEATKTKQDSTGISKPPVKPTIKDTLSGELPIAEGNYIIHIVATGESLFGISKKYNVPIEKLKNLNGMSSNTVRVGQKLKIMTINDTPAQGTKEEKSEPKDEKGKPVYHVVMAGEGLYSIAKKYGVNIEQLKTWNKLKENEVNYGQQIIVGFE